MKDHTLKYKLKHVDPTNARVGIIKGKGDPIRTHTRGLSRAELSLRETFKTLKYNSTKFRQEVNVQSLLC